MNDADFLRAFDECRIPQDEWTHEAHLRMAFLKLKENSDWKKALPLVRNGIQRLNAVIGVKQRGYHETITQAFLRLVAKRLNQDPKVDWDSFKRKHPELLSSKILEIYYSTEKLDRPEAKHSFVEPDRKILP